MAHPLTSRPVVLDALDAVLWWLTAASAVVLVNGALRELTLGELAS